MYLPFIHMPEQGVFGISTLGWKVALVAPEADAYVMIHEMGHALSSRLEDEYQERIVPSYVRSTNCTINPDKDYTYGGKMYGGKIIGCMGKRLTTGETIYRPTVGSLMNVGSASIRFNIPSCGNILKFILNSVNSAKSYFPECATMDTEK